MKSRAAKILAAFTDLGVRLHPNSRIAQQIDIYLDSKGILPEAIEPDHALFPIIVEAQRDLNQIAFALKQLMPVVPRAEIKSRLQRLVHDNVLPQENAEQSPGRDAQVELFVAALCMRAQLNPVFDESPDLRCNLSGQMLGVAIKRIKVAPERFEKGFQKCVRGAASQIADSKLPGIVVVDISQARNPTNWWVPLEIPDIQFDASWNLHITQFKKRFDMPLLEWTRGKNVRGLILIDHILRFPPTKIWRMELRCASMDFSPYNQRRRREFKSFDDQFKHAVLHPEEMERGSTQAGGEAKKT